jgi:glutathione S-transferase
VIPLSFHRSLIRGANIHSCLEDLLTAEKGSAAYAHAKDALLSELRQLNATVSNDRPYCGGAAPNAWDLALAPRVHIVRTGCRTILGWDPLVGLPSARDYLNRWSGRKSWRNVASFDGESIAEDLKRKAARAHDV